MQGDHLAFGLARGATTSEDQPGTKDQLSPNRRHITSTCKPSADRGLTTTGLPTTTTATTPNNSIAIVGGPGISLSFGARTAPSAGWQEVRPEPGLAP